MGGAASGWQTQRESIPKGAGSGVTEPGGVTRGKEGTAPSTPRHAVPPEVSMSLGTTSPNASRRCCHLSAALGTWGAEVIWG